MASKCSGCAPISVVILLSRMMESDPGIPPSPYFVQGKGKEKGTPVKTPVTFGLFEPEGRIKESSEWGRGVSPTSVVTGYHKCIKSFLCIGGEANVNLAKHRTALVRDVGTSVATLLRYNYPKRAPNQIADLWYDCEIIPSQVDSQGEDSDIEEEDEEGQCPSGEAHSSSDEENKSFKSKSRVYDCRWNPLLYWPFEENHRISKFMVGKTSIARNRTFLTSLKQRYNRKYMEEGYTHLSAVCIVDPVSSGMKGKSAEKLALDIESDLHDIFRDHEAFDSDLSDSSSGSLVKKDHDQKCYIVYIALKLEPPEVWALQNVTGEPEDEQQHSVMESSIWEHYLLYCIYMGVLLAIVYLIRFVIDLIYFKVRPPFANHYYHGLGWSGYP